MQDLRYALRLLSGSPVFTLTASLSLAIGIGANATIFGVAHALLWRSPAGVSEPERLVDIGVTRNGVGFSAGSYLNYLDISGRATTLEGVFALTRSPEALSLAGPRGNVTVAYGTQASANYFTVLGVVPAAGRLFGPGDLTGSSADSIVVLSHRFWSRRFNRDPAVVGSALRLNSRPYTVVGVAAERFQGTGVRAPDLWLPVRNGGRRAGAWLVMGGRLEPGTSMAQASAELDAIGRALEREHPVEKRGTSLRVLAASPTPGETGPLSAFVALLMAIVLLVLAIACANVSGMLLARAAARRREIALRLAVGASRGRIVRQLLTETVLLFVLGACAGLVLAQWMMAVVASRLPTLPFPIDLALALDWRAIAFAMLLSLGAALVTGLLPALQASGHDMTRDLRDESPRVFGRLRLRHAVLVGQMSLSVLLVIVAGLFVRALREVATQDPGFDPRGVEVAGIDLSMTGHTRETASLFVREVLDSLRRVPGVEAATVSAVLPGGFEGIGLGPLSVPGDAESSGAARGAEPNDSRSYPVWNIVEPGYFATLRMPLVAGRDISHADRSDTQPVVVIGEGAARRFWPGQSAVGRYLQQGTGPDAKALLVVGVARDPRIGSLVDGTTGLYAYVPLQQQYLDGWPLTIVARATHGGRLTAEIRGVVSALAPALPVLSAQTAEEYAALGLVPQRAVAALSGSLGIVGLVLAGIGIYGLVAYTVAAQTREIGIRIALGAQRADVVRTVLRRGLVLIAVSAAIGLTLGAAAGQLLSGLLFGIAPTDTIVFGAAVTLLAAVGLTACLVPTRRALRIDAAVALRRE